MRLAPLAASVAALLFIAPAAHAELPFDLRPILVGEVDYRVHSATDLEGEDGFAVGRLRLGARASFTSWFSTAVQVELGGESPRILDASVTVRPAPEWEISFGASQTPLFSSARDEPIWSLPVPELSMVTRAFWPGFDAGLEVHRLPTPRLPIEGWLRVGNGSGSALGNDNNDYALDARLDAVFGRALPGAPARLPFGLRFGVGGHLESAEDRLGITGSTADGFLFYRPPTVSGPRHVVESHLVVYAGPVKLTVEGAMAKEGRSRTPTVTRDTSRLPGRGDVARRLRRAGLDDLRPLAPPWLLAGADARADVGPRRARARRARGAARPRDARERRRTGRRDGGIDRGALVGDELRRAFGSDVFYRLRQATDRGAGSVERVARHGAGDGAAPLLNRPHRRRRQPEPRVCLSTSGHSRALS